MRLARWLVPAQRCLTLPVAVRRKRFLVPLWVFCLGMTFTWLTDRGIVGESETSHYREGAAETKEGALAREDCDLARLAALHTAQYRICLPEVSDHAQRFPRRCSRKL